MRKFKKKMSEKHQWKPISMKELHTFMDKVNPERYLNDCSVSDQAKPVPEKEGEK